MINFQKLAAIATGSLIFSSIVIFEVGQDLRQNLATRNATRMAQYNSFSEQICKSAGGIVLPVLSAQTEKDRAPLHADGEVAPQVVRLVPVESADYVIAPCNVKHSMRYVLLHFAGSDHCVTYGFAYLKLYCKPIETLDQKWVFKVDSDDIYAVKISDIGSIIADEPNSVELFTENDAYKNLFDNTGYVERYASMRTTHWMTGAPDPNAVVFSKAELDARNKNDSYHQVLADEHLLHRLVYKACSGRPGDTVLQYKAQEVDQFERASTFKVSCGNQSNGVIRRETMIAFPNSFNVANEIQTDPKYIQVNLR